MNWRRYFFYHEEFGFLKVEELHSNKLVLLDFRRPSHLVDSKKL